MHQAKHRRGTMVAVVAACLLVLQSFLSAWTVAAMPAAPRLDAFGNPICISGMVHRSTSPANDHPKLLDCCAFGCTSGSPLPVAAPAGGLGLLRPLSSTHVRFEFFTTVDILSPDHDPGSPRAPPLTV